MIRRTLYFALLSIAILWAAAAIYVDLPVAWLRLPLALFVPVAVLASFRYLPKRAYAVGGALFALVLLWWLSIPPSGNRDWLADVAQTPWAQVDGDKVTIHNVRNFGYRAELDYLPNWETRTVELSKITGIDFFVNTWGPKYIAHPILSFQFSNAPPLAFSIETRKEKGEEYSALLGFFRQFELIYIIGDERDLVRVRTNYRQNEDLYLYRTITTPDFARAIFLDYLKAANELNKSPRWYNALTTNCTTMVVPHIDVAGRRLSPWDWRILLNGYMDKMAYEAGLFEGNLPFDELRRRAHINEAAHAANDSPDFSRLIRLNRPGF